MRNVIRPSMFSIAQQFFMEFCEFANRKSNIIRVNEALDGKEDNIFIQDKQQAHIFDANKKKTE